MRKAIWLATSFALGALAACGGEADGTGQPQAESEQATAEAAPAPVAENWAAYVGKYPFDEVNGVSWNDNPAVKSAVEATVGDAAVLKTIFETPGPAAPIEMIGGKVSAWACEQHNCGPHQWTVQIDPATGTADVCYFNEEADSANSRWFLAGGQEETRPGNCQLEASE